MGIVETKVITYDVQCNKCKKLASGKQPSTHTKIKQAIDMAASLGWGVIHNEWHCADCLTFHAQSKAAKKLTPLQLDLLRKMSEGARLSYSSGVRTGYFHLSSKAEGQPAVFHDDPRETTVKALLDRALICEIPDGSMFARSVSYNLTEEGRKAAEAAREAVSA